MRVMLSAAVTADGFLDDTTPARLVISTPADWADVLRLRAEHDAILVGAETLRRDNPALVLRDPAAREARRQAGFNPDIAKVTLTRSGCLSPAMRFFTEGEAARYVFSPEALPQLNSVAEVIRTEGAVTAREIVTELEKRGIERLFVEGGAQILRLFLCEGVADTLRLAVNPGIRLGQIGCALFDCALPENTPCVKENLDGMLVATYTFHRDTTAEDLHHLQTAIEESRKCTPSASSYCVGAIIITADGEQFNGYTHETSATRHAEQEAIAKALAAGASLRAATIYSSMEPCSQRRSEPVSCSELIRRHGFARAVFALYEPDRFARCQGALNMRAAGIDVRCYPGLGEQVRQINAHLE